MAYNICETRRRKEKKKIDVSHKPIASTRFGKQEPVNLWLVAATNSSLVTSTTLVRVCKHCGSVYLP